MDDVEKSYIVGEIYFRLSYYDEHLIYPEIETVVYLGEGAELKEELNGKTGFLYFQDAESFAKLGSLNCLSSKQNRDEIVVRATEKRDAKLMIFDIEGLISELNP